jgi:hypothetical protein
LVQQEPLALEAGILSQRTDMCSFCFLVLQTYPGLQRVPENDVMVYKRHLAKEHGWTEEISP